MVSRTRYLLRKCIDLALDRRNTGAALVPNPTGVPRAAGGQSPPLNSPLHPCELVVKSKASSADQNLSLEPAGFRDRPYPELVIQVPIGYDTRHSGLRKGRSYATHWSTPP